MRIHPTAISISVLVLAVVASAGSAGAQSLPPGPTFPINVTFDTEAPTGPYEQVQMVLDFPPGAWTPSHEHGGEVFVTVLSGEMTVRGDTGEQVYGVGDHWMEQPGEHHVAGNATGETARVLAVWLLPQGNALTSVENSTPTDDLPPGPTLVYETRAPGISLSGPIDVTQLVADFAPGAWTPSHEHAGLGLVTTLEGEITIRDATGERTYQQGESWTEGAGEVAAAGNEGDSLARLAASFVLADGEPLTTVHDETAQVPASLPATGGPDLIWVIIAMGLASMGIGIGLRHRARALGREF